MQSKMNKLSFTALDASVTDCLITSTFIIQVCIVILQVS